LAATRQTSQRITLLMLVLASITVITLDYRGEASHAINHVRNAIADALSPFQSAVAAALHPLGDVVSAAFHYGQLQSENQQLREMVGEQSRQIAADKYAKATIAEVFNLNNLPFAPNVPKVPAEVISASTSNFAKDVEIDRGTASGVGVGMPVVAASGLVGTVVAASDSTATIQLLTAAPASSISVEDPGSGIYLAGGQGGSECSPLCIATTTPNPAPRHGDLLVTSGENAGAYPPAIPIGTVTAVNPVPGGLSSSVAIEPKVDLANLQYVDVLQWLRPA
jgi:rod shape-determining protein MreC